MSPDPADNNPALIPAYNQESPQGGRTAAEFRRGLLKSIPVTIGVIPFGFVLGALAAQKGLFAPEVALMTGLNFAGGSEFAAIQVWTNPPQILLIAALTFLVNSRHLLMGATLAPFLQHHPKRKVLPALFLMCDESWALGYEDAHQRLGLGLHNAFSLPFYLGAGVGVYSTWVLSSTVGALLGPILGDLHSLGIDMAFPAVFLVLLRGLWKSFKAARPWLVSLLVGALVHLLVPGAWYVVSGTAAGLLSAYLWGPQHD